MFRNSLQFARSSPVAVVAGLRSCLASTCSLALLEQLLLGGTTFLTMLLIGRHCGPAELGVFSLGLTIVYLMLAAQESLVSTPYVIFAPRVQGSSKDLYRRSTLIHHFVLSALVVFSLLSAAALQFVLHADTGVFAITCVLALVTPFWLLRELGRRLSFAELKASTAVRMALTICLVQLGMLLLFDAAGNLSAATGFIAVGVGSGCAGLGWLWMNRSGLLSGHSNVLADLRQNLGYGKWLFAGQATSVASLNVIPWLIVILLGPVATGVFAACDTILRFINPVIIALGNVLLPKTAHAYASHGFREVARIVVRVSVLLGTFALVFCLFVVVASGQLLRIFFGEGFEQYRTVLILLAVGKLIMMLGQAATYGLTAVGRANVNLLCTLAGLLVTTFCGLALIPWLGLTGAAVACLLGSAAATTSALSAYAMLIVRDRRQQTPRQLAVSNPRSVPRVSHRVESENVALVETCIAEAGQ